MCVLFDTPCNGPTCCFTTLLTHIWLYALPQTNQMALQLWKKDLRLNHLHSWFLLDFFNLFFKTSLFSCCHVVMLLGVDRVSQISFLRDFHQFSTVSIGSCALRPSRNSSGVQISPEHSVWCMICYLCAERRPTRHYTGMTHCDR